jgi:UTP--glucose-1-phosphate uridylyltransferase
MAREHVGDHAFAVLLADDIMIDDARLLRSMLDVHDQDGGSVLALMEMTREEISAYGCAEVEPVRDGVVLVHSVVEKPRPEDAPSNLAVIGRYVLTPGIFPALDRTPPGVGGEIQITDAIGLLLDDQPVRGVVFSEGRYDIGQKLDFLRANIEVALDRPDIGPDLAAIVSDVMRRRGIT